MQTRNRLTVAGIKRLNAPGFHHDGGGLYLQVTLGVDQSPRRSWVLRVRVPGGRLREMGLGSADIIALADARTEADAARKLALAGRDPIDARKASRWNAAIDAANAMTFKQCATAYIKAHRSSWKNAKHAEQWTSTLKRYAYAVFGQVPIKAVNVAMVMKVLDPIWTSKTETASRVRGRIEAVLDWAAVRGYRGGENPARWRGHLQKALPARAKAQRVRHQPALPISEIEGFMAALRQQVGLGALALEFAILTAARTGEVLRARWEEIDLDKGVWTVPAARMKAGRDHRVPLSSTALTLLGRLRLLSADGWVFPGGGAAKHLSNMSMLAVLRRMKRTDITVHGFRSTFRDWTSEHTDFPREVAEAALAHVVGDKAEAAYRRGDLFDKRRELMQRWAEACEDAPAAEKIVHRPSEPEPGDDAGAVDRRLLAERGGSGGELHSQSLRRLRQQNSLHGARLRSAQRR